MKYRYSPTAEGEKDRLHRQSKSYYKFDMAAIEEATLGKNVLIALDIGCANGELTFSRFCDERFAKVIGVDRDEAAVGEANSHRTDEKFRFYVLDLENEGALKDLTQNEGKFDLVFGALVLHHLSDPQKFLGKLKEHIADGGKLVLRCSDDGGKMCFPYGELLDEFLLRYDRAIASTDRFLGRKLFGMLEKAGYKDIKMRYHVADTCGKDRSIRENMFQIGFGFREKAIESLESSDERLKEEKKWLLLALERLRKAFSEPDFWYCNTSYIAIAEV